MKPAQEPERDRVATETDIRPRSGRSPAASVILATLATAYTLAISGPFLMPIAFAWLAKVAFAPVVRLGRRAGLGAPVSAAAIVLSVVGIGAFGLYQLSGPASEWAQRLPENIREIRSRIETGVDLQTPIANVTKASEAVADLAESNTPGGKPLDVAVVTRRPTADLLGGLWAVGANLAITLVLLYFMLATGDAFLTKVVESMPRLSDAKTAVATARAIEESISCYLTTLVTVNAILGVLVGLTCWSFGLPNPVLWGAAAAVFNFVPYLGAVCGVLIVAAVGITTLDDLAMGLAPAAVYAVVNVIEGIVVTPIVLGRRLTLSPVIVFIWLLLLSWLWGIPGVLLAVPILAAVKITCDHVPRLQLIGRLLGR